MQVAADAVAHKIPYHRKPLAFHHSLNRGAYVAERCAGLYYRNARVEGRLGYLEQPCRVGVDLCPPAP